MTGTTGRVAFVTGGSRGIGRATAVAPRGARAIGSPSAIRRTRPERRRPRSQSRLRAGPRSPVCAAVDDVAAVDAAFSEIESTFGPVEILVNNAGITRDGLIARMSDESWDAVLGVNLSGPFHTIRRAVPKMMRARFGRIVNVASVVAHAGGAGQANYSAAKAGLLGLSRSVARELGSRGITCNVVAPGPIVTGMTEAMGDEWLAGVGALVPLGRPGTAEECAAVIAFLCSDPAGYVTGALVPVDGGLGMGA